MRHRMLIGLCMGILALFVGCTDASQSAKPSTVSDTSIPEVVENKSETELKYRPYTKELTQEECDLLVQVVLAECRGESIMGQIAVAQCIRDAMEYENTTAVEIISKYQYATKVDWDTISSQSIEIAKDVIDKVFVKGVRATPYRILYFYNPDKVQSQWHESQKYVMTLGNHKFFDIKEQE